MTFRQEVRNVLIKSTKRKEPDLEAALDRIEDIHKRHRNLEIEEKLTSGPTNTKFSRLLFSKELRNTLKDYEPKHD